MRRHLVLILASLLFAAGCTSRTAPAPAPLPVVLPPVERRPVSILAEPPVPAQGTLVPYSDENLGVTLAYPEGVGEPEHDGQGGLVVPLASGDLTVYRMAHPPELSPMESISELIDSDTLASNGRVAVIERGNLQVGGYDGAYVQSAFPSAAGRWDRVFIIVPVGSIEYRISCGTKQGPPVTLWAQVQPICRQVLGTIQLQPFPATVQPLSLRFQDQNHGWVGASLRGCEDHPQARCSGAVWTTADAGAHWDRRYLGPVIPLALDVTASAVWIAGGPVGPNEWIPGLDGAPGELLRSTDGGATWESAFTSPDSPFRYVHFVDDRTGWLGNAEHLWRTDDAGRTWNAVTTPRCTALPPGQGCFFSFWSASEGVALSAGGRQAGREAKALWITRDAGEHWEMVASVTTEPTRGSTSLPQIGYVQSLVMSSPS